ncbi:MULTISPECIES: dienelactone hydrolase family protein [unclassified Janthinobacterium]|uniref:dienelactone hydrolase family protein n=1 Tax=unclassified Janthinobacterium TaxID=2610881 RepID=UPI00160BB327|nr:MULTISPECIES: CocE/NonD family hydrolase [unclassified Janthinobacterium]MBB5607162.1 dienelactone hydrolase [Janthinobacterium sp. S3T4]MBB5612887.1 dienelactone hydrolase [Janthinobacterium sp. S3M3]
MFSVYPLESAIFRPHPSLLALLCLCLCLFSVPSLAQRLPAQLPLDTRLNEQIVMVPAGPGGREMLETTIFRPSGPGPFPLLLMNHGKQEGPARQQKRERFIYMATEFVRRGYAVMLPMRSGFALSTGAYRDHGCDMTANGVAQARDVLDALAYARRQSWVDPERILVAGQSYGGLAAMALATANLPGVRGLLNFAGGLRVDKPVCDWQSSLAKAYATFGAYSQVPSLWLYGANDSYFGPQLAQRWYRSYTGSGGKAELFAYGSFKRDAHLTLGSRDGVAIWLPRVERFLDSIGMPTRPVYSVIDPPPPPETHFALLDDVGAVPFLADQGRAAYRAFLGKQLPRAFAVSETGAWGWAEEGESPDYRALASCQQSSSKPCHLYLVDDSVVWPPPGNASSAAGGAE